MKKVEITQRLDDIKHQLRENSNKHNLNGFQIATITRLDVILNKFNQNQLNKITSIKYGILNRDNILFIELYMPTKGYGLVLIVESNTISYDLINQKTKNILMNDLNDLVNILSFFFEFGYFKNLKQ